MELRARGISGVLQSSTGGLRHVGNATITCCIQLRGRKSETPRELADRFPGCTRCTAAFELEAQSGLQVLHLHWECQSVPVHWIGLDPDAQPAPMHWTALDSDAQPAPMHWIGLDPDAQPAPMHWIGLDPDALQLLCINLIPLCEQNLTLSA